MSRTRAAAAVFAACAVVAASLLGAAPATAATLPTGATIDVVGDEDGGLYSVNPANAVTSLVGGPPSGLSITAIDVNQSGQGYAVGQADGGSQLYSANAVTGTFEYLTDITWGGTDLPGCQAIDLSASGVITVSCLVPTDGPIISLIGTVTPTDGDIVGITDISTDDDDIVRALASSPTGTMYYITEFGEVVILNTTTGESTPTVTVDGRILAADFDITGQLWVTIGVEGEENPAPNSLGTLSVATGVLTPIAEYTNADDEDFDTVSITVWGGMIAATGSPLQDLLPLGLGALLLLLAGVALAITHRITHRGGSSKP
jgi:hypothetical protein